VIQRGEIWWANIPPPAGSEPGYRRPVLVVQTDSFNQSGIGTVVALAFTSNLDRASAPGNVFCPRQDTGMRNDSVANVSQLAALDKRWLTSRISMLPPDLLHEIENGMRFLLGL
jgi:mRNA interferase MazF